MKLTTKAVIIGILGIPIITQVPNNATAGDLEWYPVAAWEMNERPNRTVLHDLSGNNLDGVIGARVDPIKRRYHKFPREPRKEVRPAHIDYVHDNDLLDPGFRDFAVVVRFNWSSKRHDMNLVQKGQGNPEGGIFKMKTTVPAAGQPQGHIKCLFRGSTGNAQVESYSGAKVNDGKWHNVRCERFNGETYMYMDGKLVDHNTNQPGEISNTWPIAIGGNTFCEDTATEENQCNYWWGKIGFVRWLYN